MSLNMIRAMNLLKMTPAEQRIAIAKWCGWKHSGIHSPITPGDDGILRLSPDGKNCVTASLLPDYLNDLNAMHEAETKLNETEKRTFINRLVGQIEWNSATGLNWGVAHATAAQRAEALLRTLSLWPESAPK